MTFEWPPALQRTPTTDRERNNAFRVSLAKAFDELETELERVGVDDHRYGFAAPQRKRDQRPYADSNPDDPGFVLRWTMDGDQFAIACDRYQQFRSNVRAVGLYLREKRKMEQRPVVTGESEFANARLPSGDETVVAQRPAHDVLGVDRDADPEAVEQAYRERVKEAHPDHGGSEEDLQRVRQAKEVLLDGE
ncbi:J domain-containing protein [Halomicrobium sp. HM KBTZ05]|uniref:J domain-containing protein n=1 Tax=Halomicrobium sp. HM KBTZ05 TaxID=3242663 RepID=UPI0035562CA5